MGLVTADQLRGLLAKEAARFRIDAPVESADTWYLGQAGLHKRDPMFRFGYWVDLSDAARFYALPLNVDDAGVDGVAIVFRQFDSSPYSAAPSEYFAGWVPPERASQGEGWIDEMNRRIADLLAVKHLARKSPPATCPSCRSAEYRPEPPASRQADGDDVYLSVPMRCASCGHSDALVFELDMAPSALPS